LSPPLSFGPPWRKLVERAGSVVNLAAKLGVSKSTLHHWISGRVRPGHITRAHVDRYAENEKLPRPFGGK
jgi:hypothetical protein